MATAGWYPDPSGHPGAFRYWDGGRWGETLADHPYGPPPGGATPTPPPPPGGFENTAAIGPLRPTDPESSEAGAVPPPPPPPGPSTPAYGTPLPAMSEQAAQAEQADKRRRPVRTLLLLLLAILATLLIGVASFVVVRDLIEDDAGAASSDQPSSTSATPAAEDPTLDPSTAVPAPEPGPEEPAVGVPVEPLDPTVEQCSGGLPDRGVEAPQEEALAGGGIEVWVPGDFAPVLEQAAAFTFADGVTARSKLVEQSETSGWVAVYAAGALSRANGFDSPAQAAEVVAACVTQSTSFYSSISGLAELGSTEVVLDGRSAWELTHEVRIDDPALTVEGDVIKVVVVDTGDEATYGLFLSVVPIGDRAMLDEQDAAVESLRVP
ncbi:DUF2510 domain-containing protein [Nocardioides sp.]|uniref:DUF2510 domain-containing protein n=1 Tax=Nocardioides sp. TaxID=35761 RepID=UPI002B27829F|nr:DUF2510 domain-containing protein [Nocardioides sp.]